MSAQSYSWTIPLSITVSLGSPPQLVQQRKLQTGEARGQERLFGSPRQLVFPEASKRFSLVDLPKPGFSWQNALNAALCSSVVYSSHQIVRQTTLDDWKFDNCQWIQAENTECFVASTEDAIIVGFRGTQQISDWLVNLNLVTKSRPYGPVHRGFYFAFDCVRQQLETAFENLNAKKKSIILAGHSLGGAIATVAAVEWFGTYPINGIYTIGQPAVGFSSLRSAIAIRYPRMFHRFVNDDDIVPKVPPTYRHVGKLYHFDNKGGVRLESLTRSVSEVSEDTPTLSRPEFEALRARLASAKSVTASQPTRAEERALLAEGFLPSFSDHNRDIYIEKTLQKLDQMEG